jgi:hypothetical protein
MCYRIILEVVTAFGTVGAVIVAMIAINNANKNSKQQIIVGKLEELFETIQTLTRYYGKFMELSSHAFAFKEQIKVTKLLNTYSDYYSYRDKLISEDERNQIIVYLSRIEVLTRCYTKGKLKEQALKYEDLMFSFAEFVFDGGSIHQELKYKEGFPSYEEFYALVETIKAEIISQIEI